MRFKDLEGEFEYLPEALFLEDFDGNILDVNSEACRLLGYEKSELLQQKVEDIVPEGQSVFMAKEIDQATKASESIETVNIREDGTKVPVELRGRIIENHGKKGILVSVRDITDRVQAKQELEEGKQQYQKYFEELGDAIFILAMGGEDHGKILDVNPTAVEQTGYSREELVGMNMIEDLSLGPPSEMDYEEADQKISRGETVSFTEKKRKKNGDEYWTEVVVSPIEYEGKEANLSINRDITERKEASEKLEKAVKQFRRAFQLAPYPMMIHAEDGQVAAINYTWLEITGYEREDISTISDWTEKAYGEARNNVIEHIEKLYELEDRIDEGESEIQTKDGEARIWDFSSAPIGESFDGKRLVLSIADDVTDRKRMEKKVEEERDRAEKYLDIAGSIIVFIDEQGKVAEINKKGCEILGYDKGEIVEKNWFDNFIPERVRETIIEESRKPLMRGNIEEAEYYENPILTKDGEERVIAWENTVVQEEGEIVGHLSSGIDITDRKRMEEQIQEDRQKLRQSFVELAETTSRVLGVRDPYTEQHEQRVAELAREVGKRMGLEEDTLLGLYLGGMLHDIGKIAIPETILTKPGELKDVEWKMIKSHPKVGYNQILEDTDFPWPVAEMTLHHHERLDGSGYPHGLEGDELTKEVRILGAVDVVEAMSTRRPYREARSQERTLNVIKDGKGGEFGPKVVEVLVEMVEEGEIEFGGE